MKAELNFKPIEQAEVIGERFQSSPSSARNPKGHQFFLEDPVIEDVSLKGVSPVLAARVRSGLQAVSREGLIPIYILRADDLKTSVAKLLLPYAVIRITLLIKVRRRYAPQLHNSYLRKSHRLRYLRILKFERTGRPSRPRVETFACLSFSGAFIR